MVRRRQILSLVEISNHVPLVIVFTANWLSQSEIVEVVANKIKNSEMHPNVITIDIDEDESLLSTYNISTVPSALIVKNRRIVKKINGTFSKKDVLDQLIS